MDYSKHFSTRVTPQSEPIPGQNQVPNSAGGFAYPVDDWMRLRRFLILGSEGGTYYISEPKLTKENANAVLRCLDTDGVRVVNTVVEVSDQGLAPKNDPALFVLAMASAHKNDATRRAATDALRKVARIGTHIFHFAHYVEAFRGWGRALRHAVSSWYTEPDVEKLAFQVLKYQQRDGWSHRDLLRLSHPKTDDPQRDALFKYIVKGEIEHDVTPEIVFAAEGLKLATPDAAAKLIRDYKLPREIVPTELLERVDVWEALLENMGMTAMIRNLGKMASIKLLAPMADATHRVVKALTDQEALHKARIHPVTVLAALKVFSQGHGQLGKLTWVPCHEIVDALDEAFYLSFKNIEPTGKRILVGLDVSTSMLAEMVNGMPYLNAREASAAMAMAVARSETFYHFVGFTCGSGGYRSAALTPLAISGRQRIDDVVKLVNNLNFGGTDCSLPMIYAGMEKLAIDCFHVYTDSETWAGRIHPSQALRAYREASGIAAKLVVWGMASNGFSIADPNDGGMMDVVGLDSGAFNVVNDFVGHMPKLEAKAGA